MNFFTIKSFQSDCGGILSPQEIEHEANKISKSIQSEIERQFNQFETRIVVRNDTTIESNHPQSSDFESKKPNI